MRSGFTLVEALVALALIGLVGGAAAGFMRLAHKSTCATLESTDALRSVLLATESLRRDAGCMVFAADADLSILPDGRGFSMLVPVDLGAALWAADTTPVSYALRPAASVSGAFELVRTDRRGSRAIPGCLLRDLVVRYVPRGELSERVEYLEVSLIGVGPGGGRSYAGAVLLPLRRVEMPPLYTLPEGGEHET